MPKLNKYFNSILMYYLYKDHHICVQKVKTPSIFNDVIKN